MVSRRLSELLGVGLFGLSLLWLIALATYEPADPAWFFSAASPAPPANFVGRVGAFLSELSFQLLGYASYVVPAVAAIAGWQSFWCRQVDAVYTKIVGLGLIVGSMTSFLSLAFGRGQLDSTALLPGGWMGQGLADMLRQYFNTSGSLIVSRLTFTVGVILSTQFSFGRGFKAVATMMGEAVERQAQSIAERRQERRKNRQRREIIEKVAKRASGEAKPAAASRAAPAGTSRGSTPEPQATPPAAPPRSRRLPRSSSR